MSITSIRALRVLMPLSAASAISSQALAILTNDWLYTEEYMPNENYVKFKMPPEMEYLRKYTSSGLWILCHNKPPASEMHCVGIDYFSSEEYIPDQNDSTMAIPYSYKKSLIYILMSTFVLLLGEAIYLCRKPCGHRQIYTFITGISFILAGLTVLAGLVVYISTFKGEVSNKLRPLSEFQDALFHYRYGFSFLMFVLSLILCEISGTLSIFLYVAQKQFEIMIDSEREEVLKKNILNLLATKPASGARTISIPQEQQPVLKIICEDENGTPIAANLPYPATTSAIDHNLLSVDPLGMDPFYYCGRYGTRGRRNSRSNESYLGSIESRSRKNSFTSMLDEPTTVYHHNPETRAESEKSTQEVALRELHVPSLVQFHPFSQMNTLTPELHSNANNNNRFTLANEGSPLTERHLKNDENAHESREMTMPYVLPLPAQQTMRRTTNMNNKDQLRNRHSLTRQTSLGSNPNRSTFV